MRTKLFPPIAVLVLVQLSPVSGQEFAPQELCDQLAAHPKDKYRFSAGVGDRLVNVDKAIAACEKAIAKHPKVSRFHFQLGRSLYLAGKMSLAERSLKIAASSDYAPAFAYLGALMEKNSDKIIAQIGHKLLLQAAKKGFAPAKTMHLSVAKTTTGKSADNTKAAMSAPVGSNAVQRARIKYLRKVSNRTKSAPIFDASGFAKPDILQRLYSGSVGRSDRRNILQMYYFHFLNEMMSTKGIGVYQAQCLQLYDTGLSGRLASAMVNASGLGGNYNQVSRRGWQLLGETLQRIQRGGVGGMMRDAGRRKDFEDSGRKDATLLAQRYGCSHRAVKVIYTNMQRLFAGGSLIQPPEMMKKKRILELQDKATKQCKTRFDQSNFCSCFIGRLRKINFNITAWRDLAKNFDHAAGVLLAAPKPRQILHSCYDN